MATLTVTVDGTPITATYTVTAPPTPPGGMPLAYLVTSPMGVIGAGFQNAGCASKSGGKVAYGADVAGVHVSTDGGSSFRPMRDGAGSSDKSRICGMAFTANERSLYVYTTGHDSRPDGTTGVGVTGNYLLRMDFAADDTPGKWVEVAKVAGAWASAQNDHQKGDVKAAVESGHPRHSKNRCLLLDEVRGHALLASADGIWRQPLAGGAAVRAWGAGNAVTCLVMDPNDSTVVYATVDLGPKVGVWKLTGLHTGTVSESGCVGARFDYPQSVDVVKVGPKTAVVVATGKQLTPGDRTEGLQWLPPGASWAVGSWRDITGTIGAGDSTMKGLRVAGVAARASADGSGYDLAVSHSWDTNPGGTTPRVWWVFGWDGTGSPVWDRPAAGNTTYKVAGSLSEWWFQPLQPTLMGDKSGFDSVSPFFVDSGTIIWPGRSGAWRYRKTLGVNAFHPACNGLLATYAWNILSYRGDPAGRFVVVGDTDWGALRLPAPWEQPIMGTGSFLGRPDGRPAYGLAQNPTGTCVAVASSEGGEGGVYTCANVMATNPTWVAEHSTGSGKPPEGEWRGVALWGSGSSLVLLATLRGSGTWRKVGSGAAGEWSKVLPEAAAAKKMNRTRFAVSGDTVVVCDQGAGVWRSTGKGAAGSWTSVKSGAAGGITSGKVFADPTTAGRFYLTFGGDLWRLNAGDATASVFKAFGKAEAVVVSAAGHIYVTEGGDAKLWRLPAGASVWQNLTSVSWRQTCGIVRDADITPEGILIVANQAAYCATLVEV